MPMTPKAYIPPEHLKTCSCCTFVWDDFKEPACFCRLGRDPGKCEGPTVPDPHACRLTDDPGRTSGDIMSGMSTTFSDKKEEHCSPK